MNALKLGTVLGLLALCTAAPARAQEEGAGSITPRYFRARNISSFARTEIRLRWEAGEDKGAHRYEILRSSGGEESFESLALLSSATLEFIDLHSSVKKKDLDTLERALEDFDAQDTDGDGALTLEEFDGSEEIFDLARPKLPEGSEGWAAEAAGVTYAEGCEHIDPTTMTIGPKTVLTRGDLEAILAELRFDESQSFQYRIIATAADGERAPPVDLPGAVTAERGGIAAFQWFTAGLFDWNRGWLLVVTTLICSAVIFYIYQARRGVNLKIRKIAGLEAVDEAVGRATEMGRSILFVPGNQDMNDIQTIAGISVLSRVAKTAAEFDAKVEVPTSRALVMTTAREAVHAAFLSAGRPDAYNEDLIYYVTDEQFGYVAYLSGMMVREKPAACFYMGAFYAESLILAETGNSIGAIQVAGTAMPAQLPFFVAACDYTLIGEEFFAASAYLSGSAEELGSLKGQDVGKVLVAVILVVACAVASMAQLAEGTGDDFWRDVQGFITQSLLT